MNNEERLQGIRGLIELALVYMERDDSHHLAKAILLIVIDEYYEKVLEDGGTAEVYLTELLDKQQERRANRQNDESA